MVLPYTATERPNKSPACKPIPSVAVRNTGLGLHEPAAFRGIASRVTPIPIEGFGIPPPEFHELCGVRVLSNPTLVPLRQDIEELFQPALDRRIPALVMLDGSGVSLYLLGVYLHNCQHGQSS